MCNILCWKYKRVGVVRRRMIPLNSLLQHSFNCYAYSSSITIHSVLRRLEKL
ncbi:hypothetical protein HanRHA438_Chr07g0319731 [Helianthus annuus]|nr:hypothetical protein HanRHA438_Chr07g0319731 [Helianthus annuus]